MKETILEIVARMSSRVFLGPELCRNPAWLRITVDYTTNLFFGVMALKKWHRLLHPIVWRFVPEVRKVRQQIEEAVRLIQPVVDERIAESRSSTASSSKAKYTDAIQWAHELADGRPYHPALLQLGFSLAAIHTTTDQLSQTLYDLCSHPEYIEPLRDELVTVLKESGMTKAGLFKLKLMDSFMKESQRIKPGAMSQYLSPYPLNLNLIFNSSHDATFGNGGCNSFQWRLSTPRYTNWLPITLAFQPEGLLRAGQI